EILFTVVNEYTDWERTVQHPINTRDATVAALSDAEFVAPLVQTGDLLASAAAAQPPPPPPPPGAPPSERPHTPRAFFYVFDYQTKEGDYPQRMGTVHGEELPNPNEQQKQEPVLAGSRERNRFRSIVWDEK
ncbi:uncharacterized protein GBIM_00332, partial [Gryllus bimaculatus]